MKLDLVKTFAMPGGVDASWAFLQDIAGVAGCMPGARITERVDDRHYKGTVAVKVGPASLSFRGDIEVMEVDAANRRVHLIGRGSDTTGGSGASMDLTAYIEPGADAASSTLVGRSEVTVNGKAAAFGGRMMGSVTEQILKQFAANFAANVERLQAAATATLAAGTTPASGDTRAAAVATPLPGATAAAPAAPTNNELSAIGLLWAVVRDWFRGLFRGSAG